MKYCITTLALCLLALSATAQWESLSGPTGDGVTDFLQSGPDLLVSTNNGVFRSTDQGDSWEIASNDLRGIRIDGMTRQNNAIYAFSEPEDRLFRSDDEGQSWTEILFTGIPYSINSFHQIATTNTALFLFTPNLYRSLDGGQTWAAITPPALLTYYYTRFYTAGDVLFVVVPSYGIYRSTDQGDSWELLTAGLPKVPYRGFVFGSQLVASFNSGGWKIYRSTDLGQTWAQDVTTGLKGSMDQYGVHNGRLYGISSNRIWSRPLNGNTWSAGATTADAPFLSAWNVPISFRIKFFSAGSRLFATSYNGIFYSDDAGAHWQETDAGLANISARDILLTPNAVFCAASSSLYKFDQATAQWSQHGADIAPGTILLGLSEANGRLYAGGQRKLWASDDKGGSWKQVSSTFLDYYTRVVASGSTLLAGSSWGVYRSENGGNTWAFSAEGMGKFEIDALIYPFIQTLVAAGDTVLAASSDALYRSEDGGLHWTQTDAGTGAVQLSRFGQRLYRVTSTGGVWYSDDTGASWQTVDFNHPDAVRCMAGGQDLLFAGTKGGVLISKDGGATWTFYSDGMLSNLWVVDLELDGGYLYAGTESDGVWRFSLTDVVVDASIRLPKKLELLMYPNPATDAIWLNFPLQPGKSALIQLWDNQRRLIRTETAGAAPYRLDCAALQPGAYSVHVGIGNDTWYTGNFLLK